MLKEGNGEREGGGARGPMPVGRCCGRIQICIVFVCRVVLFFTCIIHSVAYLVAISEFEFSGYYRGSSIHLALSRGGRGGVTVVAGSWYDIWRMYGRQSVLKRKPVNV